MALSLDKPRLDNLAGDIGKSAERLRGKFKAYEYPLFVRQRACSRFFCARQRAAHRSAVLQARPNLSQTLLAKVVKRGDYARSTSLRAA